MVAVRGRKATAGGLKSGNAVGDSRHRVSSDSYFCCTGDIQSEAA